MSDERAQPAEPKARTSQGDPEVGRTCCLYERRGKPQDCYCRRYCPGFTPGYGGAA